MFRDRYHATAIDNDAHFIRCMIYIDLNMVRNGVVSHPSEWGFCGYNEIMTPRKKCVLIAYKKLFKLAGFSSYEAFVKTYKHLLNESLINAGNCREAQWTESIAVGSKDFTASIKDKLGILAKGRQVIETDVSYQLREDSGAYIAVSDGKKGDIGPKNIYYWGDYA